MTKSIRYLAVIGLIVAAGGAADAAFAVCSDGLTQIYPVLQCGSAGATAPSPNWFDAPPPGSGSITAVWWQVGFGNNTDANGGDPVGNGFVAGIPFPPPGTPSRFIGNDSGLNSGDPSLLNMVDASLVGGPPRGLCFAGGATWTRVGVDGCADNDRDGAPGTFTGSSNDNHLNPYYYTGFGAAGQFGTPNFDYYIDAPMGVLLTESTGLSFALAFFANYPRDKDPTDSSPGQFDMQVINTGNLNPITGLANIVPWQSVPQPIISATFSNPGDTNSQRVLTLGWPPVRIVDDSSTRQGRVGLLPSGRGGVGARDQGPLVHHVIETAPAGAGGVCGTFTEDSASLVSHPQNTTTTTVDQDTCVRLKTRFGVLPRETVINKTNAGLGLLGDIGYEVVSNTTLIGGPLVANGVRLEEVSDSGSFYTVRFKSMSELDVSRFEVVGIRQNGREFVLETSDCTSCSTGMGHSYVVPIDKVALRGAKQIVVVMQPSGDRSNIMDVEVGHQRGNAPVDENPRSPRGRKRN